MKHLFLIYTATTLLISNCINIQAVENGDNREAVISELGEPQKNIKSGDYEQLIYERGQIELLEGTVVGTDIITLEELAKRRKATEEAIEQARKTAEELHSPENIRRGLEKKAVMVNSVSFTSMSGADRVAELRKFGAQYPGVDITTELLTALADWEKEEIENARPPIDYEKYEAARAQLQNAQDRENNQDIMNAQHYLMMRDIIYPYIGYSSGYGYGRRSPYRRPGHNRPAPFRPGGSSMYPSYRPPRR